jgi:hypothetical protein
VLARSTLLTNDSPHSSAQTQSTRSGVESFGMHTLTSSEFDLQSLGLQLHTHSQTPATANIPRRGRRSPPVPEIQPPQGQQIISSRSGPVDVILTGESSAMSTAAVRVAQSEDGVPPMRESFSSHAASALSKVPAAEAVAQLVHCSIPEAEVLSHAGDQVTFQLPKERGADIPGLLRAIEVCLLPISLRLLDVQHWKPPY